MAFKVVTIADRISQYPDRRRLTKEDGSSELVTVAAEEGSVSSEGTEWGAAYANDLETRIDAETHLLEGNFGTVETTTTASKAYVIGDCLVLNGQLYKVIAAISQGATLVVGTNIAVHSVSAINSNLGSLQFKYESNKGYYRLVGADTWIPFKAAPTDYYTAITVSIVSSTVYRIVTAGEWAVKWSFTATHGSYSHNFSWDLHTGKCLDNSTDITIKMTKESANSFLLDVSTSIGSTSSSLWDVSNQIGMSV